VTALVLRNGRLAGEPIRRHLVIDGGSIAAICDDHDLADNAPAGAEHIDLAGATVTPGLVDSHTHPVWGIGLTRGLDLSGCGDLDQLRAALAAAEPGPDGWLIGWGLDPNVFGDAPVDNAVLGDTPVYLQMFDAHAALASREVLRRAAINGAREFASGSRIVCDDAGRPTGLLLEEEAMAPAAAALPVQSFAERRARLAGLFAQMSVTGLTGGHVMDCQPDTEALLSSLDEAGELPLRLRVAPWRRPQDDEAAVAELLARQGRGGRLWSITGAKLFMDGTVDHGTAWLFEPDCHGASTDAYWRDPDEYTRAVRDLAANGVRTATHAIGDAAVAHVLAALAGLDPALRHRVEHIETLPDDLVRGFVENRVVASMQPTHATLYVHADHSDNWSQRLGADRADRGWRCRDLHDAGALLTLGSDWPIAPFDPRTIIADAQLRRPFDQPDSVPLGPSQALTAAQALAGYTSGPAEAVGEQNLGRVAVGFAADLTVWAEDPLAVPAAELPGIPIVLTVVDGVVRHRAS
jgi:predicted amidohydrolase YtcJ